VGWFDLVCLDILPRTEKGGRNSANMNTESETEPIGKFTEFRYSPITYQPPIVLNRKFYMRFGDWNRCFIMFSISSDDIRNDDDNVDCAGFVYLNKSEVQEGVSPGQLRAIVSSYVSAVYASEGPDLYDVLLYQYYGHVQQDWTSSSSSRDHAAIRDLLMRLLADGHQVSRCAVGQLSLLLSLGRK